MLLHCPNPKDGPLERRNNQRDIREELACYSTGMSSKMKRNFKFANISGNAYNDITGRCLEEDYNMNISVSAAVG